eukprot:GFKZ01000512.1.p1 GENE.GFKZ01000512.1~~GFKZ01000512.1.p1  ORF type:complete len:141 (+),score=19.25 GFKZ01000512.1:584-1006(+)
MQNVLSTCEGPSTAIQRISIILSEAETVNKIVFAEGNPHTATTATSTNRPNVLHDPGAPVVCVTLEEALAVRRAEQQQREQETAEREQRRITRTRERERSKTDEIARRRVTEMARGKERALVAERRSKQKQRGRQRKRNG